MKLNIKRETFAQVICFYKLFWIFFIGCFVGAVVETIYCLAVTGHFEIRWGVIYGPFNPVYGFGALIMTLISCKVANKRDLWIFLICMFSGGVCEYFCSFFQEKIFHTISWDYKDTQFNFNGRTNSLYAFFWGLLWLVWVKDIFPRLSRLIEKIPAKKGKILTLILLVYMVLNMTISGLAALRQKQRYENIPANSWLSSTLDKLYPDEFLEKFYPNLQRVDQK